MILTFLFGVIVGILNAVVSTLHLPLVTELPLGLDSYLSNGMDWVRFIAGLIPPLAIMLNGFLWVVSWKFVLMMLRVFRVLPK